MENGLFIVGNKRSGSTLLMRLLNLHPQIFISNESDIIWILFNYVNNHKLKAYPEDSPGGMDRSIKAAGKLLSKKKSPLENYLVFQKSLLKSGFLRQEPSQKTNLRYIGDQKPYQHGDPDLVPFILDIFPKAKFLHLIRHPFEVIRSSQEFLDGTGGYIWKGMNSDMIFDKWARHEKNVILSRKKFGLNIQTIFYQDLIDSTEKSMVKIFDFLELDYSQETLRQSNSLIRIKFRDMVQYPITDSGGEIMEHYGFEKSFSLLKRKVLPQLNRLISKKIELKKNKESK
jgi:Sulfotransferase family